MTHVSCVSCVTSLGFGFLVYNIIVNDSILALQICHENAAEKHTQNALQSHEKDRDRESWRPGVVPGGGLGEQRFGD